MIDTVKPTAGDRILIALQADPKPKGRGDE